MPPEFGSEPQKRLASPNNYMQDSLLLLGESVASTKLSHLAMWVAAGSMTFSVANPVHAQSTTETATVADEAAVEGEDMEAITVLGSRREGRSAVGSAVPVDVLRGADLTAQGSTDIVDTLISVVPSLNANREPISNGATLIRPLNLRSLPSDHTRVLVNGKRRHRGAVVGEFVTGINKGAQGVDVYPLFGLGLSQVEILRDGASAQYGSDAIAGVVNYSLLNDPTVRMASLQYSQAYEGDGTTLEGSGAFGIPIADDGFITLAFQVRDQGSTSRGVQDGGALALTEAGYSVKDPVVEWGQPNVRDDYKFFLNSAFEVTSDAELYTFGSFSSRNVDGSFYFRNPRTRNGVYVDPRSGDDNFALFGDLTGEGNCPTAPLPTESFAAAQAFVDAAPDNCFSFFEAFPNGFTPRFGGDVQDISVFTGFRGTSFDGLKYDFSIGFGENRIDYRISNTVNASLGPDSPYSFYLGRQKQSEVVANMDFSYGLDLNLASPLNIAIGLQYLNEEFAIESGDLDSYRAGPLATQGFSVGSNGFQGFPDSIEGVFEREAYSLYLDLEADVTDWFLVSAAVRYEDFSDFGDTLNGKLAARVQLGELLAFRGSVSTGFRAPTLGQSNVQRSSTTFLDGLLAESLVISTTDPVAEYFGGGPLDPETSLNFSGGMTLGLGKFNFTLDYFNISVDGRIALLPKTLTDEDRGELVSRGVANASTLSQVQFFINDFDTQTQGVDLVANYLLRWFGGTTNLVFAANWTDTQVTDRGTTINDIKEKELEDTLPEFRLTGTISHFVNSFDALVRVNYYTEAFELLFTDTSLPVETPPLAIVDAEFGWQFTDIVRIAVGAKNIFDTYPEEWSLGGATGRSAGYLGAIYPLNHPAGLNGGTYYARISATL